MIKRIDETPWTLNMDKATNILAGCGSKANERWACLYNSANVCTQGFRTPPLPETKRLIRQLTARRGGLGCPRRNA